MLRGVLIIVVASLAFCQVAFAQDSLFAPAVNYAAGGNPHTVFAADFDVDGNYDLAVINNSTNNVSILKNNGDGTFQAAVNYGVGSDPRSVFAADLDGDGDMDLAVANWASHNISILINNGDGTFQSALNYWAGSYPRSVFAADLDGDGDNDLAVANDIVPGNVSILKNSGNGTFQSAGSYGTGNFSYSVFAIDLDGDGDMDLAVANATSNDVSILKNNGNGTFQTAVNYGVGSYPMSVYASNLDGDGDNDLAVANLFSDNVSILKNNGDGTFQAAVNYGVGTNPASVFAADFYGDGDSDLVVANQGSNNVSILRNNGDGTFQAPVNYSVGISPQSVFASDLDGDGDNDLAVANPISNNVSVLINLTSLNTPLTAFHLTFPFDNAITNGREMIWSSSISSHSEYLISYKVYWDEENTFNTPDSSSELTDTTFILPEAFSRSHKYNWRVRAKGDSAEYRYSAETFSFYLDGYPTSPAILNPANGEHVDSSAYLNWLAATDPDSFDVVTYSVQIDNDSLFSSPELYDTVTTGAILDDAVSIAIKQLAGYQNLQHNQLYYWRVRADDHYGLSSAWPESLHYFVYMPQNHPPEPFTLLSPLSGIRRVDYNTYFKWNSTADYDPLSNFNFYLQYCGDSLFNDLVITLLRGRDTSLTLPTNSLGIFGQTIYWRVLAIDDDSLIRVGGIPEQFRKITIVPPGDANGDGNVIGGDVTYLVRYFKGLNPAPVPLLSGDANADCQLRGSDVTYLVAYFKGINPAPLRGNCEQPPVNLSTKPKTE